jgi:hypothetical protein
MVEPTGLCLLALHAAGTDRGASGGLAWLKTGREATGGIGVYPGDPEGNWMAYAALLAFHVWGDAEEARALQDWMLGFRPGHERLTEEQVTAIRSHFRYDPTIEGWPWCGNSNAWVEPTSLFLTALLHTGCDPAGPRIRSGIRLLIDRRLRGGGWNYGVPFDAWTPQAPEPLPTALALTALTAAGFSDSDPALRGSWDAQMGLPEEDFSAAALGWTVLAAKTAGPALRPEAERRGRWLSSRQLPDGSVRGSPAETALALLASGEFRFRSAPARGGA